MSFPERDVTEQQIDAWIEENRGHLDAPIDGQAPVVRAVVRDQVVALRALIWAGARIAGTFPGILVGPVSATATGEDWPLTVIAGRHAAVRSLALLLERGEPVPTLHGDAILARIAGARPQDIAALLVEKFLAAGVRGTTCAKPPLLLSAHDGNLRAVESFLAAGIPIDVRSADGETALHAAATSAQAEIASALLARGADPDALDGKGQSPLAAAERAGAFEVALVLLQHGSRPVGRLGPHSIAGLERALHAGESLDRADPRPPMRTLWAWLRWKRYDLVAELAEAGMSVERSDELGNVPWNFVLEKGPRELAARLVPCLVDRDRALRSVCSRARADLAELLLAAGARPDALPEGGTETALFCALAGRASASLLDLLVAHGATLAPDAAPLVHGAVRGKHLDGLQWLAARGAALDLPWRDWGTPLQVALRRRFHDVARFLVEHGANLDITDDQGRSPLEHAREHAHPALVDALVARIGDGAATAR